MKKLRHCKTRKLKCKWQVWDQNKFHFCELLSQKCLHQRPFLKDKYLPELLLTTKQRHCFQKIWLNFQSCPSLYIIFLRKNIKNTKIIKVGPKHRVLVCILGSRADPWLWRQKIYKVLVKQWIKSSSMRTRFQVVYFFLFNFAVASKGTMLDVLMTKWLKPL